MLSGVHAVFLAALVGVFPLAKIAHGQASAVATTPYGYSAVALAANSETFVSVPFERPAAFVGQIASVLTNVITVEGAPNWTAGQFAYSAVTQPITYYVLIRSGAKEGLPLLVTANAANSLTVDLEALSLAGVVAGDGIRVVPCWTLATLFPANGSGLAFTPTTDPSSPATTILLASPGPAGINQAPSAYFFYSGAWRQVGQSTAFSKDDQVIRPGAPFRVRNGLDGGVLVTSGAVMMEKQFLVLGSAVDAPTDTAVALMRPMPVSLADSGLAASGAFAASADALTSTDLVLVFDNADARINKPAADYFIYANGGWRKLGQPLHLDFGSEPVFGPAKGVVIRKAATANAALPPWINSPKY